MSRVDFFATTLLDDFDEIVSNNNLTRREYLRIEVTESAYTDDPSRIIEVANALRDRATRYSWTTLEAATPLSTP